MTNLPPPDPRSSESRPLGFDDFVGVFVALAAIGAIFFWTLSRRDRGFQMPEILSQAPSPLGQLTPLPAPEAEEETTPLAPIIPPVVPTESPEPLAPAPTRTPVGQRFPAVVPVPTAPAPATPTPEASPTPEAEPTPAEAPAQPVEFVDVPENYWARPFITTLAARGIVNGFPGGYFQPDEPVTRAEYAALLQEAFNQPPGDKSVKYDDVTSDFWGAPAIDRATSTGFLQGYPGNVFQPGQPIPRVQALVALVSGLDLAPPADPAQVVQTYQDAAEIPNYATEKVATATASGLVVNYPEQNVLNPNTNATRAEVAAFIHQALVNAGKLEPVESEYIVQRSE